MWPHLHGNGIPERGTGCSGIVVKDKFIADGQYTGNC